MSYLTKELTENCFTISHEVGHNQNGIRLDAFLMQIFDKRSREKIKKSIQEGKITIERTQSPHLHLGSLKPSTSLFTGDKVQITSIKKQESEVNFKYKVLFEDDDLFIIDKPPNLPVHPAGRYFFNTLITHLRTHNANQEFYLAHRIDKETSGVLILAKNKNACTHLTEQFAQRKTEKTYLAIAHGVTPAEFEINDPLKKDEFSDLKVKMRVAKTEDDAQEARTQFKRLEAIKKFSLLLCIPKTGRQHQIRVHLAHAGYPIVGDKLYGVLEKETLLLPRHALHSHTISFTHPKTNKITKFVSPLPDDLKEFLDSQI
ncbi:MAG: RluA family pseudouridine synthase [Bdellovibrio sp.]|nr:RluA family pseudouridine synthase [Bdellovibrio sp.]